MILWSSFHYNVFTKLYFFIAINNLHFKLSPQWQILVFIYENIGKVWPSHKYTIGTTTTHLGKLIILYTLFPKTYHIYDASHIYVPHIYTQWPLWLCMPGPYRVELLTNNLAWSCIYLTQFGLISAAYWHNIFQR